MSSNVTVFNPKHILNLNDLIKDSLAEEEASSSPSSTPAGRPGITEPRGDELVSAQSSFRPGAVIELAPITSSSCGGWQSTLLLHGFQVSANRIC